MIQLTTARTAKFSITSTRYLDCCGASALKNSCPAIMRTSVRSTVSHGLLIPRPAHLFYVWYSKPCLIQMSVLCGTPLTGLYGWFAPDGMGWGDWDHTANASESACRTCFNKTSCPGSKRRPIRIATLVGRPFLIFDASTQGGWKPSGLQKVCATRVWITCYGSASVRSYALIHWWPFAVIHTFYVLLWFFRVRWTQELQHQYIEWCYWFFNWGSLRRWNPFDRQRIWLQRVIGSVQMIRLNIFSLGVQRKQGCIQIADMRLRGQKDLKGRKKRPSTQSLTTTTSRSMFWYVPTKSAWMFTGMFPQC